MTQRIDEGAVTMFLESFSMIGGALLLSELEAVTGRVDAWLARPRALGEGGEPRASGARGERELSPLGFTRRG